MGTLGMNDVEYESHDTEIWSFGQFLQKMGGFLLNRRLTPMDFEQKFVFYKTHKNSYTGPLGTSNPEYGGHCQEIQSSDQFLPKTDDFR
jgi:hypothetical protein